MNRPDIFSTGGDRRKLAAIVRMEAERGSRGDANLAGPAIEPYLAVFRDALNLNCESDRYSDRSVGYSWCGAFVYYCCLETGFRFPPKPIPSYRCTLAAVPAWHQWAMAEGFLFPPDNAATEPGDISLFNQVAEGRPLDHIGIVIETAPDSLLCAEGNVQNRTGLFWRSPANVAGYIRLGKLPENLVA